MSAAALSILRSDCIVVDLDGTLVLTDTFAATLLEALRKYPLRFVNVIAALRKGRAACKSAAASLGPLDITSLPYNEPLLEYLRQQKAGGRRIILATGADTSIAHGVACHLGIFDEVIASERGRNVTGDEKVRAIRERIGNTPFTYAGNSRSDLRVWRQSQSAILVGAPASYARDLRRAGIDVQHEIGNRHIDWKASLQCLRLHQWAKNMLVFMPIILGHHIWSLKLEWQAIIAFLAMSFSASALYVVNDLLDLQADRVHPSKRQRPLASGALSVEAGLVIAAVMVIVALLLGAFLPTQARLLLAAYAGASLSYSLKLKRMLFVDVVSLALLYAVRVLYGGAATGISISVWTLAFSLFLFTSLAVVKRLTELRKLTVGAAGMQEYRGYKDVDANQLSSLAAAAGYVAVLVLALYINSPEVTVLYSRPQGLWVLCPVLIYWISRVTLIANRGHLNDDPVAFALKDRATWVTGIVSAIIIVFST
jgi:4-hydroxybenzoate polyprenyltransferase